MYYKLSNFDSFQGIIGHECVNELIVDRLLTVLGVEHLHYQLIHADVTINDKIYTTYLNASEDFKKRGETKAAFDVFFELEHRDRETPLEFCRRYGWEDYIYQMLVIDFLILNRDRHGANIEVLRNSRKKTLRLAPLFDHGLSLLFTCDTKEKVQAFDVMDDKMTNTYIGARSTWDNLKLIPVGKEPALNVLKQTDYDFIMAGLDVVLPQYMLDKIWDMIWKRWCAYEDFCHTR